MPRNRVRGCESIEIIIVPSRRNISLPNRHFREGVAGVDAINCGILQSRENSPVVRNVITISLCN